jgi:hypothetical protein
VLHLTLDGLTSSSAARRGAFATRVFDLVFCPTGAVLEVT